MTATHNSSSIRTGCMGNVERYRVIPTPSNGGGLDPDKHVSIARALRDGAHYSTGMAGKWHLGINSNPAFSWKRPEIEREDHKFLPTSHGYETYLGSPYTNAPMCEMNEPSLGSHSSKSHGSSSTFWCKSILVLYLASATSIAPAPNILGSLPPLQY